MTVFFFYIYFPTVYFSFMIVKHKNHRSRSRAVLCIQNKKTQQMLSYWDQEKNITEKIRAVHISSIFAGDIQSHWLGLFLVLHAGIFKKYFEINVNQYICHFLTW